MNDTVIAAKPEDNSVEANQNRSAIKLWQSRINSAQKKWEPDFKRMRANMEFCTGLQWTGQAEMDDDRYVANLTLRLVNQKVAMLYAKNPTAKAVRRPRMDFQVWDGKVETLMQGIMQAQGMMQGGGTLPPELATLFADYTAGKQKQQIIERVCQTLEIVYQYFVDIQRPEFKEQMKQLVRRTIICGVGYVRPIFCRDDYTYGQPSTIDTKSDATDRVARVRALLANIQEGDVDTTSPTFTQLRSLIMSLGASEALQDDTVLPERLEFDFPSATSVIPDERCRHLKDFVAARWIAQEYILPIEEVNAIFGTDIKSGSGDGYAKEFTTQGDVIRPSMPRDQTDNDPLTKRLVAVYEVFDYTTKTRFFMVDGYKDYAVAPEPLTPNVRGFWHHFALTFNDCESEVGTKASVFPPSDVQTAKSAQKEWNRTREALRDHRNANAPKYPVRKGTLTDDDKRKLREAVPNSVIELEGVPPEQPIEKFIKPMEFAPLDPRLYDTAPLEQDLMFAGTAQQANVGPAQPDVTATVGTIAEQSRLNVMASNIDDLDGVLTRLAQAGGEMLLQEMDPATVKRIAGPGAVFPGLPESRADFLNEIFLKIEAASSGRPNKALDIQNFTQLAPLMLQAGANPIGIVEEASKRLDDTLDVSKFFPLLTPPAAGSQPTSEPTKENPANPPAGDNMAASQAPNPQNQPEQTPELQPAVGA